MSVADEINKLHHLKEQGILTEEEFSEQKRRILAEGVKEPVPIVESAPQKTRIEPILLPPEVQISFLESLGAAGIIRQPDKNDAIDVLKKTDRISGKLPRNALRERIEQRVAEHGTDEIKREWAATMGAVLPERLKTRADSAATSVSSSHNWGATVALLCFGGAAILIILTLFQAGAFGDFAIQAATKQVDSIAKQVANDQEQQYDIARRQGDKMQICVQAGMVAAAHLQAKDSSSYNRWKKKESSDCEAAGIYR